MFADKVLEKIYSDKNLDTVPIQYSSKVISIIQDVIEKIKEEDPYATISKLFDE